MRKTSLVLALTAGTTLCLAACDRLPGTDGYRDEDFDGSPGGDVRPRRRIDAATPIDGEASSTVEPYGVCESSNDCRELTTSCVPIGWTMDQSGNMIKACLYECKATKDCPYGNVCYPKGGGALGTTFALMAGHCYISYCGFGDAQNPGATGQPCSLGEELGLDTASQLPGWCMPQNDGFYGVCNEVGTKTVGDTCDFKTPTRGGSNCDATSICVGTQGAVTGKCAKLCDPATVLTRETGNSNGPVLEDCLDQSSICTDGNADPPLVATQTIGFCSPDIVACDLLAENTCPDNKKGEKQACGVSNPLRATGICAESAYGKVALDGICARPTTSVPNIAEDKECAPGHFCWPVDEKTSSYTCHKLCDTRRPSCPESIICQAILWDPGENASSTNDDNYTMGWGLCLPPSR
ncbi:MAG: hypothetical protein V2A73_00500 [Pseudomonadota bacterium]